MARTNTPTFNDAVLIANQDFHVGLPTSEDLQPGTTLYAMWQVPVTVEPPFTGAPPPGLKMLVTAEGDFAIFPNLPTLGVRIRLSVSETADVQAEPQPSRTRQPPVARARPPKGQPPPQRRAFRRQP
jgi:hypothetical protein